MRISTWWHRVSMRFFNWYLENLRRDSDITLAEYQQCAALVKKYDKDHGVY